MSINIICKTLPFAALAVSVSACNCADKQKAAPTLASSLRHDMGYSDLGCYSDEEHTPNLNIIAPNGLQFIKPILMTL